VEQVEHVARDAVLHECGAVVAEAERVEPADHVLFLPLGRVDVLGTPRHLVVLLLERRVHVLVESHLAAPLSKEEETGLPP